MNDNGGQRSRIEDLDITREELDTIGEALKDKQFRKLLCDYVDEINDPKNRALYEREIEQYERERGTEVTFVRPQPGYVLKTSSDGVRKVFVNICTCDVIQKPARRSGSGGDHWSLPHCLSPVRQDYDRAQKPCDVYDVVFHPDVLGLIKHGKSLKDMVEDTALGMVEKNNNVVLDKANLKYPKTSFKGISRSLAIRKQIKDFQESPDLQRTEIPGCPYKPPVERPIQHHDLGELKQKSLFTVPKYIIKYRSDIDIQEHAYNMHCKMNAVIPKELVVEINLPLLDSSANVELDVLPKSLKLICHKPSKYKLEVNLPYSVLEDEGNAKFDQSTKKLVVRLSVLRTEPPLKYVKNLVAEVETLKDETCKNGHDIDILNSNLGTATKNSENNVNDQESKTISANEMIATNSHHNGNINNNKNDTGCNNSNNSNAIVDDVHYILPEHEFIYGQKCILTLNVKNVDPTSINVIVINDKSLISCKFHSIGSGFFPIWFAFCIQIPSNSSLLKTDVKVIPSDKNVVLELSMNFKPDCKQYWYGLDQGNLTIQNIKIESLNENSISLANSVSVAVDHSDDDGDVDEDAFDNSKEEIELKGQTQQNTKTNNDNNCQYKDKNGKMTKEKGNKRRGKKIQKSNAIPIVVESLPETGKKIDFVPGSLPIQFNDRRPTIHGILKKRRPTIRGILKKRSFSECSNIENTILSTGMYGSSLDNVNTEYLDVLKSNFNDLSHKKTVRFNDRVDEKKVNFSLSITAQAKKQRQRQQRKRNIRDYCTPIESEVSKAEDGGYGPLNVVSEIEETSVGEMSDDNCNGPSTIFSKVTVVADSKKDHKRHKSKSARKNASLAKQASSNNLIFPIEY